MAKTPKAPTNQVRIIGGQFKRRSIGFVDADGLRPTPDRLRETLFNWLMADLLGAKVLDMCAGSGVLGFEALSRGATSVAIIEPNPKQAQMLKQNAHALSLEPSTLTIINDTAQNALGRLGDAFDVVFIDPPYALNLWQTLLDTLKTHALYHKNTLIYLESDRPLSECLDEDTLTTLELIKHTKVGQVYAHLVMFL